MKHSSNIFPHKPLTTALILGKIFYFQLSAAKKSPQVNIYESEDAKHFIKSNKSFAIKNLVKKSESINTLSYLRIFPEQQAYSAIIGFGSRHYTAVSDDGWRWELQELMPKKFSSAVVVSRYTYQKKKVLYFADHAFHIGFSEDLISWKLYDDPIFEPKLQPNQSLVILNSFVGKEEIFVPFVICTDLSGNNYFSISLAVFSKSDPRKIAWRFSQPIWSIPEEFLGQIVSPIGVVSHLKKVYSFWQGSKEREVISVEHPILEQVIFDDRKLPHRVSLKKVDHNPILSPNTNHAWGSRAVFNPAALYDEENKKVHLLYRAVGDDWTSVLGYSSSSDGIHINEQHDFPAYVPRAVFEGVSVASDPNSIYTSGPGTGGCEDPRLTKIDDKVYLTYVAYDGINGPRVAISSILYKDFVNHEWNWSYPMLISRLGVVDKNACIFPEKIDGKYIIMHRVFPHILLDFVDSLEFDGDTFLKGEHKITPRTVGWDSRKVGAGPPPIKTSYGWLLIYHAVDDREDNKYQIGAMILDLYDPTKVICRSQDPILSPTHWYENQGYKPGVVYPCGAVVIDNILHVYYGGADTYVCVATAPLSEFMDRLVNDRVASIDRLFIN